MAKLFKNDPTVAEPLPKRMAASGGWLVLLVASMMYIQVGIQSQRQLEICTKTVKNTNSKTTGNTKTVKKHK